MSLLLLLHLSLSLPRIETGLASRYGYPGTDDPLAGRSLRCHRYMTPERFAAASAEGCAHRTLPCGTRLMVYDLRTGRSASCTVCDSGPYGAMLNGRWLIKRRSSDPGTWRGILDVLPPVAAQLGLTGLHPVLIVHGR